MPNMMDIAYQPGDKIEVEVQRSVMSGLCNLYVHYNGITVLRIAKIPEGGVMLQSPHRCLDCGHQDFDHNEDGICKHANCDCMSSTYEEVII